MKPEHLQKYHLFSISLEKFSRDWLPKNTPFSGESGTRMRPPDPSDWRGRAMPAVAKYYTQWQWQCTGLCSTWVHRQDSAKSSGSAKWSAPAGHKTPLIFGLYRTVSTHKLEFYCSYEYSSTLTKILIASILIIKAIFSWNHAQNYDCLQTGKPLHFCWHVVVVVTFLRLWPALRSTLSTTHWIHGPAKCMDQWSVKGV